MLPVCPVEVTEEVLKGLVVCTTVEVELRELVIDELDADELDIDEPDDTDEVVVVTLPPPGM